MRASWELVRRTAHLSGDVEGETVDWVETEVGRGKGEKGTGELLSGSH